MSYCAEELAIGHISSSEDNYGRLRVIHCDCDRIIFSHARPSSVEQCNRFRRKLMQSGRSPVCRSRGLLHVPPGSS
jgi:hypothetical protein